MAPPPCEPAVTPGYHQRTPGRPRQGPAAVLFDRDGTLCIDIPYNTEVNRVLPVPTAVAVLARLRQAGVPSARVPSARVPSARVPNRSGVGRSLLIGNHTAARPAGAR